MGRVKQQLIEQEECQEPEGFQSFQEMAEYMGWSVAEQRQQLIESHYNIHKDIHGIKPRWINYDEYSLEQLIELVESICNERDREIKASAQELEDAVKLAMSYGAKDREQALEWLKGN